ncbi:beta-ketoacyl-ACP synthase [Xanthomonadaceae bacterium XH05]|nr:beta-ketoacyl-ACP synthase [Xanthomonadaceae bacterium XH05]
MTVYMNSMGITCALGSGVEAVADALFASDGPRGLTATSRYSPAKELMVGKVPDRLDDLAGFPLQLRGRNNALLHRAYAQIAADVVVARERYGATRIAVILGTSTSGIGEAERAVGRRDTHGWPEDFHYGQQEIGAPSTFVAVLAGVRGPTWTVSTACSSGAKALASAGRLLRAGIVDAVIAGGADSLCAFTIAGFSALDAVSPQRCLPFSAQRHGINIGEGAALFLMTREPGAVRLAGWGESSDAHHMSAPDPEGAGAIAVMQQALARAGLKAGDIDYVNLHGTATEHNDAMEARAVAAALGVDVAASSTKPLTGHALGAAGAIEAGLAWMTLAHNPLRILPPHWYDGDYDGALPRIALVAPGQRAARPLRHVLSQSFAFGGSNAALLLGAG